MGERLQEARVRMSKRALAALASPQLDRGLAVALILSFMSATWLTLYRRGTGEPDVVAMAVGVQQAALSAAGFGEPLLYRPDDHFVFYEILWSIGQADWSVESYLAAMNGIGWISGVACLLVIWILLGKLFRWRSSVPLAVATLGSSPVFFDLATYGHPTQLSIALALCAVLVVPVWQDSGFLWFVGRIVLGLSLLVAGIGVRADVVLIFPGLVMLSILSSRHSTRKTLVMSASLAVAVGLTLALRAVVLGGARGSGNPIGHLVAFMRRYADVGDSARGLGACVLALGIGLSLFVLLLAGKSMVRRRWQLLLAAAGLMAPGLVVFLGNPSPARHFVHVAIGGAMFVAAALPGRTTTNGFKTIWIAVGVVVCNLAVPRLGLLGARVVGRPLAESAVRTVDVFGRHAANLEYHRWDSTRWDEALREEHRPCVFVGDWAAETSLRRALSSGRIRLSNRSRGLRTYRTAERELTFAELYSEAREVPEVVRGFPCAVLLSRYPESLLESMPSHESIAPPPGVAFDPG